MSHEVYGNGFKRAISFGINAYLGEAWPHEGSNIFVFLLSIVVAADSLWILAGGRMFYNTRSNLCRVTPILRVNLADIELWLIKCLQSTSRAHIR